MINHLITRLSAHQRVYVRGVQLVRHSPDVIRGRYVIQKLLRDDVKVVRVRGELRTEKQRSHVERVDALSQIRPRRLLQAANVRHRHPGYLERERLRPVLLGVILASALEYNLQFKTVILAHSLN